jgi:hypothetical protein
LMALRILWRFETGKFGAHRQDRLYGYLPSH